MSRKGDTTSLIASTTPLMHTSSRTFPLSLAMKGMLSAWSAQVSNTFSGGRAN